MKFQGPGQNVIAYQAVKQQIIVTYHNFLSVLDSNARFDKPKIIFSDGGMGETLTAHK